jgi:hypothetical protein
VKVQTKREQLVASVVGSVSEGAGYAAASGAGTLARPAVCPMVCMVGFMGDTPYCCHVDRCCTTGHALVVTHQGLGWPGMVLARQSARAILWAGHNQFIPGGVPLQWAACMCACCEPTSHAACGWGSSAACWHQWLSAPGHCRPVEAFVGHLREVQEPLEAWPMPSDVSVDTPSRCTPWRTIDEDHSKCVWVVGRVHCIADWHGVAILCWLRRCTHVVKVLH